MEEEADQLFIQIDEFIDRPTPGQTIDLGPNRDRFMEHLAQLRAKNLTDTTRALLESVERNFSEALNLGIETIEITNELIAQLAVYNTTLVEMDRILDDDIQALIKAEVLAAENEAFAAARVAEIVVIISTLSIIVIILVVSRIVGRGIVSGIADTVGRLHEGAMEFSKGIFDHRIEVEKDDEVGRLGTILNDMAAKRTAMELESQRMEARLRQHQRLESIGTLAGGIAHEINNPIDGIMNYSQVIDDRLDPDSPLREFTDVVGRETRRVSEIVSNLLSFSRQDKQAHSPAEISQIVKEALSLVTTIIHRDQISITSDIPSDLPTIKCRSNQIQQVIMNMLTNGRNALNERYPEFDPNKIMELKVRTFQKDDVLWIRTTVKDHGSGISKEVLPRVFDPFFTTKERTEGTGLGLSISYGIAKDHRGNLWVESELDRYTSFHLDLPVDNGWSLGGEEEE